MEKYLEVETEEKHIVEFLISQQLVTVDTDTASTEIRQVEIID